MSELPRTDELPRSEEGYDAARVEEAFASFAERVHELESVAGELREELQALRSERLEHQRHDRQRLEHRRRSGERYENEEWPAEGGPAHVGLLPSPDWVASVPAPLTRPVTVPRFALEATFLVLVALLAGLADLSTSVIAILMASALALVVLSELATAARRTRWRLDAVADPVEAAGEGASDSTGPWSMPVVEATVVEAPDDSESHTVVTKLPPAPEPEPEAEPEVVVAETAEPAEPAEPFAAEPEDAGSEPSLPPAESDPEPKKRLGFLRRKRGAEAEARPAAVEPEAPEPPVAETEEPPVAETEEPPVAETEEPPVAEAAERPVAETEEPPVAETEELPVAETEDAPSEASIPPAEPEHEPQRRLGFLRRKRRAEDPAPETPDPWEI